MSLSTAATDALLAYDWPGNVRELERVIERAVALAGGPFLELDDLPPALLGDYAEVLLPALREPIDDEGVGEPLCEACARTVQQQQAAGLPAAWNLVPHASESSEGATGEAAVAAQSVALEVAPSRV